MGKIDPLKWEKVDPLKWEKVDQLNGNRGKSSLAEIGKQYTEMGKIDPLIWVISRLTEILKN